MRAHPSGGYTNLKAVVMRSRVGWTRHNEGVMR